MTRLNGLARIVKRVVEDTPTSPQSTVMAPGGTGWQLGVTRMGGWNWVDITAAVGELHVPASPYNAGVSW